jgi:uncharacterized protein (DUF885 family)
LNSLAERLQSSEFQTLLPAYQREALSYLLRRGGEAYGRHSDFLKRRLLPHARDSWALGRVEYKRRFALIYGNRVSLDDLVLDAETELHRVKEEMIALSRRLRPDLSPGEVLESLRRKYPATEKELITAYAQVQKKIDDNITKQMGLRVRPPSYLPSPPGVPVDSITNWPAPLLFRGDALVLVARSSGGLKDNALVELPWRAAHEGNPGHAAQSLLFQSAFNEGRAPLCRFLNVADEVGYVRGNWYAMANIEGWAFYTERLLLASELLTPEERLAALTGQALRAARVIVDIRLHTRGWSRADVANYLVREAGLPIEAAEAQALRYSRIPLQALSYYFGARQFEELHRKYGERFGNTFYQQLLSLGAIPPMLIDDYLKTL